MTLDAVGGVWRYALDVAGGLAAYGVQVILVGFGPNPNEIQKQEISALDLPWVWVDEPLDWLAENATSLARVSAAIDELGRRFNADVLHLNLPSQAADLDVELPIVVVSHSCVVTWWQALRGTTDLPIAWHWLRCANRAGFDRADLVLAPTRSHAKAVVRAYGAVGPITVVPNASCGTPHLKSKQPFGLAAGRWWDEAKNGAALDACAESAEWPILAAGPLKGPNGQCIRFTKARALGTKSAGEMSELMGQAAIFIAPSLYEPFGLAVLEAASAGAALVLADIAGFRELWDDAALFVDPNDPAAFAVAVNRLSRDGTLRERLAKQARARTRHFTLERQCGALLEVYQTARGRHRHKLASVA